MNFRNDINGLRAIAVLAVMLFHFGVPGVRGGFIGVDVFFVISGYLMTVLIFKRLDAGRFSLSAFYADRARRIVPALAFLCAALLFAGWFILLPFQYALLGKHVASSMGFFSNIVFWREAGYFDLSAAEKWLLHTWSLSVEWQFYLFYPLLVLGLRNFLPKDSSRWILVCLAIASFIFSCWLSAHSPGAAFYLLPTRAWELLLGGFVWLFPYSPGGRTRILIEWAGAGLILASAVLIDRSVAWPGWCAACPSVGALMILLAARGDSVLTGNPPAQLLGKSSYSVYLWHWPVVAALNHVGRLDKPLWCFGGIVASLLLGYLSYVFVEVPTRGLGKRTAQLPGSHNMWQLTAFAAPALLMGVFGSVVFFVNGIPGGIRAINSDPRSIFVEGYEELHRNGLQRAYRAECDFHDWDTKKSKTLIDESCTRADGNVHIFLWGDSHAQALSLGLRGFFKGRSSVAQVATSSCEPAIADSSAHGVVDNSCNLSNRFALSSIGKLKPAVVVLAQAAFHERTDWDAIVVRLHSLGVEHVVLVGPMPHWDPSLAIVVTRKYWNVPYSYVNDGLDGGSFDTDRFLEEKYGRSKSLLYVSVTRALCSGAGCLAKVPGTGNLMVVDSAHLSPSGSEYVAQTILGQRLSPLLTLVGANN